MTDPGLVEERRQFNARIWVLEQQHATLIDGLEALVKKTLALRRQYQQVGQFDAGAIAQNFANDLAALLRAHRKE